MKTSKKISILLLTLCLSFSLSTMAQQPETHIITLYVNTADIEKPNIDQYANFGQEAGISNRDFTIHVRKGDIVIWKGISTSSEADMVNISAINHEGGVNVFGQNVLRGNGETPELVVGTVINGNPGDEDKYKISFKVYINGTKKHGTFHIDPKIIVKP